MSLAPWSRRSCRAGRLPPLHAQWTAVASSWNTHLHSRQAVYLLSCYPFTWLFLSLTLSFLSIEAPASSSLFIMSTWPLNEALCRAVLWNWRNVNNLQDVCQRWIFFFTILWWFTNLLFVFLTMINFKCCDFIYCYVDVLNKHIIEQILTWSLTSGFPPSVRYLSTSDSLFSSAAVKNISSSTFSGWENKNHVKAHFSQSFLHFFFIFKSLKKTEKMQTYSHDTFTPFHDGQI